MELKYKFNTLEEVKTAIEKWFKDCGYDNKERAEKQYLKCIAELGEVADEICKENIVNLKLELGDLGVTLVGLALQKNEYIEIGKNEMNFEHRTLLYHIHNSLAVIKSTDLAFNLLLNLCYILKVDALECLTLAYNKIQGRLERGELSVVNGTVVKSGK